MPDISEFENLETWKKPEDKTFGDWIDSRIAKFETRTYDWNALNSRLTTIPNMPVPNAAIWGLGEQESQMTRMLSLQNTLPSRPWFCHLDVRVHLIFT